MNNEGGSRAYSISEVSQLLNIPAGTIRQWEKSLDGFLEIPRDAKGARYYTEVEINALNRVRMLREKGLQFEAIREILSIPQEQSAPVSSSLTPLADTKQTNPEQVDMLQTLKKHIDEIVNEAVKTEVSKLSETIRKQQEYIEQKLEERDQKLMAVLKEMQEAKKQAASAWWKFWK